MHKKFTHLGRGEAGEIVSVSRGLTRTSQNSVKAKFGGSNSLAVGRLALMPEEGRPTGITHEDVIEAAKHGGNVEFEGRKVRVVSISDKTGMYTQYSGDHQDLHSFPTRRSSDSARTALASMGRG